MIPWPIALLAAGYTILATTSAAAMWRHPQGHGAWSLLWAGGWCAVSVVLVAGLATLKPWARVLSIWVSIGLMISALGAGVLAIVQVPPQPMRSLLGTLMACTQVVILRYLTRPHVRVWFLNGERRKVKGEG
jgi:hypothetical protein